MSTTAVRIITILVIILIIVISAFLLFSSSEKQISQPLVTVEAEDVDPEKVIGRWQRTDGNYLIDISSLHNNGTLEAAYYNPRPINVSQADWSIVDNRVHIYVELSDVNYPGSYYKLDYFPALDRLNGIYYQAVYRQNFEVEFVRAKDQ